MGELFEQIVTAAVVAAPALFIGGATWARRSGWLQAQGAALAVAITWFLLHELGLFELVG